MMAPQVPSQVPSREGTIPFEIPGRSDLTCFTYYKVFGELGSVPPVIILHGGPGAGHDTMLPFAELWPQYGLPVIFYDQIGCAASTHFPQTAGDKTFWNVDLFKTELNNLLGYFHLRKPSSTGYHLFGHSWGANLGADFATSQPPGLHRLILGSGMADRTLYRQGLELRRDELPPETAKLMREIEQQGNYDNLAYKEALMVFCKKFLCREDPFPPEILAALRHLEEDRTVQETMNGPTPFVLNGSTNDWTIIPRAHQITAPTLVYNGEYDTSHDIAQMPFFELIPRVRWITFANGSHSCHLESGGLREKVFKTIGDFLISGQQYGKP